MWTKSVRYANVGKCLWRISQRRGPISELLIKSRRDSTTVALDWAKDTRMLWYYFIVNFIVKKQEGNGFIKHRVGLKM